MAAFSKAPFSSNTMFEEIFYVPFSSNTMFEQIFYVSKKLGCSGTVLGNYKATNTEKVFGGYLESLPVQHRQAPLDYDDITYIGYHEFSIKLAAKFNETFMAKGNVIDKTNILHYHTLLTSTLDYFEQWKLNQLVPGNNRTRTGFLSPITYLHLRIGIYGFLTPAEIVLNAAN